MRRDTDMISLAMLDIASVSQNWRAQGNNIKGTNDDSDYVSGHWGSLFNHMIEYTTDVTSIDAYGLNSERLVRKKYLSFGMSEIGMNQLAGSR
jgi:hypothetical protein